MISKNKGDILREMKKKGYRITEQRKILVDIIVSSDCRCCKEIYYEALKQDPSIGIATVYRTVGALQDMGILNQEYSRARLSGVWGDEKKCSVILGGKEQTKTEDEEELYEKIKRFLQERGYLQGEEFRVMVEIEN